MTDLTPRPPSPDGTRVEELALLLESDLFFVVKVRETLKHLGYRTQTARNLAAFTQHLQATDADRPTIALVNISAHGIDWQEAIRLARAAGVPLVAYGSHVETEAQALARAAGATSVIANSKLASDLPGVITRALQRNAAASYTDGQTTSNRTTEIKTEEA